jgi:hypothetical protein
MRKVKIFLCSWILLDVLAGYGFLPMPWAGAQDVPSGITYLTTARNWSQISTTTLTARTSGSVTLDPCPLGVDYTSGAGYQVYLLDGSKSEAVKVTSGSTFSGKCALNFTPNFSHGPSSYTVKSASSGIQETINVACGTSATTYQNSQCNVTIPANGPQAGVSHTLNTYNVYGTIFFHSNQSILSGYGVSLNCLGRGACIQVGDLVSSNDYANMTVAGLSFRSPTAYTSPAWNPFIGVPITNTIRTGNVATITTGNTAHGFRPGDMVTILFTDTSGYWGDAIVSSVPTSTTFTYAHAAPNLASQNTPGVVALAYDAVLDNAENTHLIDITYDNVGEAWSFNNFFDFWDDENAVIDHFNNNAISLMHTVHWTGSFVFSAGNQGAGHQIAPVITLRDSNITANDVNGVTVYNSNGLYIENTVIQASGPWEVYAANYTGNYQGAYLKNIYSESTLAQNPSSPTISPWPGLGIAGLIAGTSSGSFQIEGNGGLIGAFPTGGAGSTPYTYYIVANDVTAGTQTSPMQILNWESTGSDSIPVRWPRIANGADTITYDVLRMTTPVGVNSVYPYNGGCPGGSGGTCGYVAKGLSQATACSGGLVCTYTDTGASTTSAYTIQQGTYHGIITFWPGALVSVGGGVQVDREQYPVVGIGTYGNPLQIAKFCTYNGVASPGGYTLCLGSQTMNGPYDQTATILTDGGAIGGGGTDVKGRLNFSSTPLGALAAHEIITLVDSQPTLTQATWMYRSPASAHDTWIGIDGGTTLSTAQLAFGSPVSITNYIANVPGGSWLEKLSASLKEFNVPAKFDQSISVSHLIISATAPTISSGFGTSPSVVHYNGTAVFTVNVGTGGTASSGVIGLPTAANGWAVHCDDVTMQSTSVFITKQTASSTTSATITQYSDAAVPTAWAAHDILVCQAAAY